VALQHVPPIPLSPNTFTGRLRIVIEKRLRKFECRPEVCGATNGSNTKPAWDMGFIFIMTWVYFLSTIFLPISFLNSHIIPNHLSYVSKPHCNSTNHISRTNQRSFQSRQITIKFFFRVAGWDIHKKTSVLPFKDKWKTPLFKGPFRTAL
jgi:hypothetical protein